MIFSEIRNQYKDTPKLFRYAQSISGMKLTKELFGYMTKGVIWDLIMHDKFLWKEIIQCKTMS